MSKALYNHIQQLFTNERYFWPFACLVVLGDAILTALITKFIPYTEIDWETYMLQIKQYKEGERNYSNITGPTGPLVYPAGHVHIHNLLYDITDSGRNLPLAQQIYALLYIVSLILSCAIYRQSRGIPNYALVFLSLSRRLHSIFVLRLFNDCWSVVIMQSSILAYQRRRDLLGTVLFSAALSVKMNHLLYVPAIGLFLLKRTGLQAALGHLVIVVALQISVAQQFLFVDPWAYLKMSFDFSRVFLYKWTVNWRFVPEDIFLDRQFAKALLLGHLTVLGLFGLFRWCRNDGGAIAVIRRGISYPQLSAGYVPLTGDYIISTLFTANLIGITFARSLHYQFLSWYQYQIPFLLWRTKYSLPMKIGLFMSIEYAWNVFPSTNISSAVLLLAHSSILFGVWFGYPAGKSSKAYVEQGYTRT